MRDGSRPPALLFAHPGAELYGSDRMLLESVAGAIEAGARCTVVLPEDGPLAAALRGIGATVVRSPAFVLRKALLRPAGWPRLAASAVRGAIGGWRLLVRERPDRVVVSTVTMPLWPVLAALRGIPSVSHVHEAEAEASRLRSAVLYAPHALSRRVLTNSAFSRATMRRASPSLAARTRVVPNGVDGPPSAALPRPAVDGPLRVLYVGRLSPRKGPDVLLDALSLLVERGVDARLDLVGGAFRGYEWFEAELRRTVVERGLAGRVALHGYRATIWPDLSRSDVLVVPSTGEESFGNTAVEGVLAMRPVVVSDSSGLREAVRGLPTAALVPPGDPAALAAAIERVRDRWPALRARLAESASIAHERHDPARYRARFAREVLEGVSPAVGARDSSSSDGRRRA